MKSTYKACAIPDIPKIVARCRVAFNKNVVKTVPQRKDVLRQLLKLINENETALCGACTKDLGKHAFETYVTEISMARNEIFLALDNLDQWTKPEKVHREGLMKIEDCVIERDPLGVVLIIGAWNYPVQLTLVPAIQAIAAGNTVVIKPSEVSENTAQLIAELVPRYVSTDVVGIVNGGIPETTALLTERFDHILYTGNARVARIVMTAAAKHLTPVTLELGGKSPTVVDDNVDVDIVARRIMWGRFVNAGQTCIAPDYLLVKRSIKDRLVQALKRAREAFCGSNPAECKDFARIVNEFHFNRVKQLMSGGKIVVGGETDAATKFIAPTVLDDVDLAHPLMTDEIFGPLLPIVSIDDAQEAIEFINKRDKPLALYIFSNDANFYNNIIRNTSSGGVTVNDVLMHVAVDSLPFGGVGNSGMGAYHGKNGFDTFSHKKSVMRRKLALEFTNDLRYPPYNETKRRWLTFLLMKTSEKKSFFGFVLAAMVAIVGMLVLKQ